MFLCSFNSNTVLYTYTYYIDYVNSFMKFLRLYLKKNHMLHELKIYRNIYSNIFPRILQLFSSTTFNKHEKNTFLWNYVWSAKPFSHPSPIQHCQYFFKSDSAIYTSIYIYTRTCHLMSETTVKRDSCSTRAFSSKILCRPETWVMTSMINDK